jgi:hypothetical protein
LREIITYAKTTRTTGGVLIRTSNITVFSLVVAILAIAAVAFAAKDPSKAVAAANRRAMGSAPCAWSVPVSKPDGSLDVEQTIAMLKQAGFSCEIAVVGGSPSRTWNDFKKLAAAADSAGIDLWPVILPPSEGTSEPYGHDYLAWADALARLSLQYPHVRGFNIDDLDQGVSPQTFTRDYVCRIYNAKQKSNPKLLFVPTIYDLDRKVADRLAGCVDGVWLWWVNLEKATGLPSFLENSKLATADRFPIYGGVYAHWTSWHKQGNPLPEVFEETLEDSCGHADGAMIWNISLELKDPLLEVTKKFLPGGDSPFAGKCGSPVAATKGSK